MDYVHGRACKMTVFKEDDKLLILDDWYDHTNGQYRRLLNHFNIELKTENEHGMACNCEDCQLKNFNKE
jgi:hypothetical protein